MPEPIQDRSRVYLAGPLSSDPTANTHRAIDIGSLIVDMGGDPFIPHLSHYRDKRFPRSYSFYVAEDLRWLTVCDALFRFEGESKGADGEVAEAERLGIPVFYTLDELAKWLREWNGVHRTEAAEERNVTLEAARERAIRQFMVFGFCPPGIRSAERCASSHCQDCLREWLMKGESKDA